ncbi:MAG TPA: hypothetical protein PK200_18570 [Spirochaetota bacterium]|nr:hypothetical protein [Spirochaetota bacterium]
MKNTDAGKPKRAPPAALRRIVTAVIQDSETALRIVSFSGMDIRDDSRSEHDKNREQDTMCPAPCRLQITDLRLLR